MATYVLIHGAGDVSFYWHLVAADLSQRGHEVIAVDLPADDPEAGLNDYADTVVAAIGDYDPNDELIVVGHSFGGYTAPLVAARVPTRLLVLVAAMIPQPGESASEMFANTGWGQEEKEEQADSSDIAAVFYHDVPPDLAAEALSKGRDQAGKPMEEPWPLAAWPDVPTRFILCRNDRMFSAAWLRRVVQDRLGFIPDEIETGHTPALSRPRELSDRLETYRESLTAVR